MQANFSGDWKKRQEINLQLTWLTVVKEVETRDIFGEKKSDDETSLLIKLTDEDIKFPKQWKLDDLFCYPFSQEIIAGYGKVLAENDYEGMFKPDSILPYPKDIIRKAILFTFDYFNYDKPLYEIPNKEDRANNLDTASVFLDMTFVDTGNEDIPKDGIANRIVGRKFQEKQPEHDKISDFKLIDWKSEIDWIVHGVRMIDKTNDYNWLDTTPQLSNLKEKFQHDAKISDYEWALACFERAKEINPISNDIKVVTGITYLSMAEFYSNKGEEEQKITYMRKSASLGNKEAISWLNENFNFKIE